jgi:Tfp pilus assembly protein PilF
MKDTIKQKITAALNQLQQGDPDAAINAIDEILNWQVSPAQIKLILTIEKLRAKIQDAIDWLRAYYLTAWRW